MIDLPSVDPLQAKEYHFKQCGWLPHDLNPNRLLSLLAMFEVHAIQYVNIGVAIQAISDNISVNLAPDEKLSAAGSSSIVNALNTIVKYSKELNLAVSAGIAAKFLRDYAKTAPTYGQTREDIRSLKLSLDVELDTRKFFFVPPERSEYYSGDEFFLVGKFFGKMEPFQEVLKVFPSTGDDLVEAGNCLALDRPTACVFHLMRVMEVGLKAIAKALGFTYSSNWGKCLADIEKQGQRAEPFFIEAVAYLRSVKNAWRNPTMHIERIYSEQEAEHIFNAVQAFMQHLASRLTE
jgi:hypothetical protein